MSEAEHPDRLKPDHQVTVEDVRVCADRLDLLDYYTLPPYGQGACARTTGVVERRITALDAEIRRLTRLRDQLAARTGTSIPM